MDIPPTVIKTPVQPRRIKDLFSQRSLGSLYLSSTLGLLHLLIRLGVKPREEGWRKYATAFLRTEDSRFILMPLADFCSPPGDDTKDAIIAIGNFSMPTTAGAAAGVVCVKSVKGDINQYWEAIYNAVTHWHV